MLLALIGGCALFGLIVGSFLNVVIYRVPRKESIVTPRSHCPSCQALIKEYDNIPVFSWLILKGHCRHCGVAISPRYIFVEVACAGLFAGLAARLGYNWELPAFLVLFAGLLCLACIDLETLLLPKSVVYPVLILVTLFMVGASADFGRLASTDRRGHLRGGMVCPVFRHQPRKSSNARLRRCSPRSSSRTWTRLVRMALRRHRILRSECDRRR